MILGFDFGATNSVAIGLDDEGAMSILSADTVCRRYEYVDPTTDAVSAVDVVPSLIGLDGDAAVIGAEADADEGSVRWLKLEVLSGPHRTVRVDNRAVNCRELATRLVIGQLNAILDANPGWRGADLAVTVPVDCGDTYTQWLVDTVATTGAGRVQVVDEAMAAILGACDRPDPNDAYAIIDVGAGSTTVRIVRPDGADGRSNHCRVMATVREEVGSATIDRWIIDAMEFSKQLGVAEKRALRRSVDEAKQTLCYEQRAVVSTLSKQSGECLSMTLTRDRFDEILKEHGFLATIDRAMDRAFAKVVNTYGIGPEQLAGVIALGGGAVIPCLRERLSQRFGSRLVQANPFTTVAYGACRFGSDAFHPIILHNYFIKAWNPVDKRDTFHRIIGRGQTFPTEAPVKILELAATHNDQTRLGMEIFELSEALRRRESLTIDGQGKLHLSEDAARELAQREALNADHHKFIIADPPCKRGEKRFLIAFGLDARKRLTVSVTDRADNGKSKVLLADGDHLPLPVTDLPLVQLNA